LIGTQACSGRSRPTYTLGHGCVVVLGDRPSFLDRGLGKPFQAVAVADFTPTDVDIDPGMDPVAVAAAWACMIGSDTPHLRARLIDRQPAEDDLTQRLQAAISSD
jgi:hypothetical protein